MENVSTVNWAGSASFRRKDAHNDARTHSSTSEAGSPPSPPLEHTETCCSNKRILLYDMLNTSRPNSLSKKPNTLRACGVRALFNEMMVRNMVTLIAPPLKRTPLD